MSGSRLALALGTPLPRDTAIQTLQDLCRKHQVDVVDFNLFSNHSMTLQVEGRASSVLSLSESLQPPPFRLSEASRLELQALTTQPPTSEIRGSIHVTFAHEDGSLKIQIPMVPG